MSTLVKLQPLFLGFWAPPVIRPQAMLLGKMLPEWLRQGVTPTLVTFDSNGEWGIDVHKHLIPRFIPKGIWCWPYLNFFAQYLYWRKIANDLVSVVRERKINVIYSFANPIESNIIGALLAKKTGIAYVAHFSDPWESEMREYSKLGLLKVRLLEKFVIKVASRITVTDEPMKMHIMKNYPPELQKKFFVINHCYDPSDYPAQVKRSPDLEGKFLISHIGSFYAKKRSPDPLFAAISVLVKLHPEMRSRIVVELIGGVSEYGGYTKEELQSSILRHTLSDIVRIIPAITYHESTALMKSSDCLVVIDMAVSYFVAMKVIDYAGADRTMVALASHGSSTEKIVTNMGYSSFAYDESEELGEYLAGLIEGRVISSPNREYIQTFHVTSTTHALLDLLCETVHDK